MLFFLAFAGLEKSAGCGQAVKEGAGGGPAPRPQANEARTPQLSSQALKLGRREVVLLRML